MVIDEPTQDICTIEVAGDGTVDAPMLPYQFSKMSILLASAALFLTTPRRVTWQQRRAMRKPSSSHARMLHPGRGDSPVEFQATKPCLPFNGLVVKFVRHGG